MKRIVLLCGCLLVWGSAGAQLTLDSCRLLALNLYSYVDKPFTAEASFDFSKFRD